MKKIVFNTATKIICVVVAVIVVGVIVAFSFTCNKKFEWITTDDINKSVVLSMWIPTAGGLEPDDNDKVMEKVNQYLSSVLPNTTLTVKYEDSNSFGSVMTRMFAAEEKFDICFTSYGTNSYFDNAKDELFYPFSSEQLSEYAPAIWADTSDDLKQLYCVNGKYSAVINNQIKARQAGVSVDMTMLRKFVAEKTDKQSYTSVTDADLDAYISENLTSLDAMTDYLAYAKEQNGTKYKFTTSMIDMDGIMYYMGLDDFGNYKIPGAIPYNATSADDIVNQFESQSFKDLLSLTKSWYGKYIDVSVMSGGITSSTYSTLSMRCLSTYKPGVEQEEYVICGKDMKGIGFGDSFVTSTSCLTTMSAVSYTSENPIRALKFLNLLYSDKTLYNLLAYGREGTDYLVKERGADDTPTQIEVFSSAKYKINNSWAYGNQYLAYPTTKQNSNVWSECQNFTDNAQKSVAYGFIFDEAPVAIEISNCINVYGNYFMQLLNNTDPNVDNGADVDMRFYNDFISALKTAGSDKIIAELKTQFAAFLSGKE